MNNTEPRVVVFCCHWCCYQMADLSGATQLHYPPDVKMNIVPCSGRVEVIDLLKAFENGADGVFVLGCFEDKCHHQNGSLYARRRVNYAKSLLKEIGLDEKRLEMINLSPATEQKPEEILGSMSEEIKKLGLSPIKGEGKL